MGFLDSIFGGGTGKTTQQSFQSREPWGPAIPWVQTAMGEAFALPRTLDLPSAPTLEKAPSVQEDPFSSASIQAAVNPLYQNFARNILPNLRGAFTSAGTPGGSREALAEGNAVNEVSRAAGDVTARMQETFYRMNLEDTLRRFMADQEAAKWTHLMGTQEKAAEAQYPLDVVRMLLGGSQGAASLGGTTQGTSTGTVQGASQSPFMQMLGLGTAAAGALGGLFGGGDTTGGGGGGGTFFGIGDNTGNAGESTGGGGGSSGLQTASQVASIAASIFAMF